MLTIITPSYNRAYTLSKCYETLCGQTSKNFNWLVIDDGSTDNTQELVQSWTDEGKIKIRYVKKENGGKASALNYALDYLQTPYCCVLDSDDYFTLDAVEKAISLLLSEKDNDACCGVIALRNNPDGTVIGGMKIPSEYKYATGAELMIKLNLRTEYIEFMRTDLVKQFPYPSFSGEKFIPPSYVDYKISDSRKFLVSQEQFCICEYIDDGLTKNKNSVIFKNPKGYTLIKLMSYERSESLKSKIRYGIMYNCGCILSRDKKWLKNAPYKLLTVILYPLGYIAYLKKFRKRVGNKIHAKN